MSVARSSTARRGFSLIEVVIATGIFALAIVAVIGLMGPMTKRAEDVIDSEVAARLSASIQSELERIGFTTGVSLTEGAGALELVANDTGTLVRLVSGSAPADRPPNDAELPGIPNRDRYFRILLSRQTGTLAYDPATSGALALRADVEWPYWIPEGPATPNPSSVSTDPHLEVPAPQRQRLSYFFALRP